MLDYLFESVVRYQNIHGLKPNLVYLNHQHLQCVLQQLETRDELSGWFHGLNIKIILSPSLGHPSFARSHSP